MKKLFTSSLALILLLPFLAAFSHIPQGANEDILKQAAQGQKLIFDRDYGGAQKHFNELWRQYPDSPLGTFGLMALYNAMMFENYDFSLDKAFAQVSYANEKIVDRVVKDPKATAWNHFLCGASAGLRGFYYVRQDKALKAMGQAGIADKCLAGALAQDPKFKDILLGQGMSLYWRSVFTQSFSKILPFFKDRRAEGLQLMKQAAEQGIIAQPLARVSLMFSYLNEGKALQALPLANQILAKHPTNIIAKLHKGRFQLRSGKTKAALESFNQVLSADPKITVALYFKGRALRQLGKNQEAKVAFEKFLKLHQNPAWLAYAHYQLGWLALKKNDRSKAFDHFKAGHKVYGGYKPNLDMVLKMRQGQ